MKLSFSLNSKSSAKSVGDAPSLKRPAAFASLDDDNSGDDAPSSTHNGGAGNSGLVAQNVMLSKSAKTRMEKEQRIDSTVYQYDEVWDSMQDAKARQKEIKERESKERKVRCLTLLPLHELSCVPKSPNTLAAYYHLLQRGGWII
jgi:coiled-coil domain-containing protein 55